MSSDNALPLQGTDKIVGRLEEVLRQHKTKYVFQGVFFIIAGVLAAMFPVMTAINIELILGVILLLTGIFQLILTLRSKVHTWSLLSSSLSILIGILILWNPLPALLAFVTLLAIFMTFEGIFELFMAFQVRPMRRWNWMFFSGVVTLVLAGILWIGFPSFDVLYLGWVVAVNFIFFGVSLLMLVWRSDT